MLARSVGCESDCALRQRNSRYRAPSRLDTPDPGLGTSPVADRLVVLPTASAKPLATIDPKFGSSAAGIWVAAKEIPPVTVGTAETCHLNRPVTLLQAAIQGLSYDARFTYLEGRDHFTLYDGDVFPRIAAQMYDVARPHHSWRPKVAFDSATELAK